jgi:hypothetical protein
MRIGSMWNAVAAILVFVGGAVAGEKTLVLQDHLGVDWSDELVTFPLEFPPGECHPASLRLRGPNGPVSVQIVRSRADPEQGDRIQSATIAFFADLRSLATDRYVVSWSADPEEAGELPPSSLTVRRSGPLVAVASPAFGAVFQTGGEEFETPAASSDVPGPLRAMHLPDGRRFGGSRMYGNSKIAAWSGEVLSEGPVFADIRWTYRYENGTEFRLRARLGARDTAIYWDMACQGTLAEDGWELDISDGLPPLSLSVQIEHFSRRSVAGRQLKVGDLVAFPVAAAPPGLLTSVTPWADWTNDQTQTVVVLTDPAGEAAFFAASRDPGVWVTPQTDPTKEVWGRNQKSLPVVKKEDGSLVLGASVMDVPGGGLRRWSTGVLPKGVWEAIQKTSQNRFTEIVQRRLQILTDKRRLDVVKDFVLAWPEAPELRRPMLIVSRDDIARARSARVLPQPLATAFAKVRNGPVSPTPDASDGIALAAWMLRGSREAATDTRIVERLRARLGMLGDFDLMRSAQLVATLFDGVIDSGLVTDAERQVMRARMAYIGYRMEDPATWSAERGFNTGLFNMNVSYALGRGIVACALPDHPRSPEWITPALRQMDDWLDNTVGTRGEWMEGASYDHVTASTMIAFAIAAKNSGYRDYSRNEKFRLLFDYIAKQYTPPDPTRGNLRVTPPLGRANAGLRMGLFGVMARFSQAAAPDYSAAMQWMWQQSGSQFSIADNRLCGLEYLYIDPQLPSRQPGWTSELFPLSTAILRDRFGQPGEDYACFLFNPEINFARPSEVGALLQWFAFGAPVAGAFTGGYAERHELLMSRVVPARSPSPEQWRAVNFHRVDGGVKASAFHRRLDYLDASYTIADGGSADWARPEGVPSWPEVVKPGTPPISWRRQVAFVKGEGPREPSYFVFRDTVESDQPTLWQFWALSNGVSESGARSSPQRATPDNGGSRPLMGSNFTATGQYGVDLDFSVLAPDEPRAFTLRWGTEYRNPPDIGYRESRDLVALRREAAGSYLVVVVPRRRGAPRAAVRLEGEGGAIRVAHEGGDDLVMLAGKDGMIESEGERYAAPVVVVHTRGSSRTVTVASPAPARN